MGRKRVMSRRRLTAIIGQEPVCSAVTKKDFGPLSDDGNGGTRFRRSPIYGPFRIVRVRSPRVVRSVSWGTAPVDLAARAAIAEIGDAHAIFHAAQLDQLAVELTQVRRPLTLHFGGADQMVPPEQVDIVRAAVAGNPQVELFLYDGADHGYTFAYQPSYHPAAARASFERALTISNAHIAANAGAAA